MAVGKVRYPGRDIWRKAATLTAAIIFPPTCLGCGILVAAPGTLCGLCWTGLRFIDKPYCAVMGTPFSHDLGEGSLSAEAIADPPPFRRARAAVIHGGVPRHMVHGLKYRDRTDLAPWMARWMVRAASELVAECDVIIPVPLHPHRFWTRRFNQSAELARAMATQSGRPFAPEALVRVKRTRQQVGLNSNERAANVRGAFHVPEKREIDVAGRAVLLVDDVYTTGATIKAASRALLRAKATAVDVVTFGRVVSGVAD